jgi:hypothetical protein
MRGGSFMQESMQESMQERYWKKLTDKRYRLIYINEYYDRSVWIQRMINIFLAISSSGAIAAWAIWKEFPVLWGGIIAASQVVTAIKPYLPYEKRIEDIYNILTQLTVICNEVEAKWYYVANGSMSEEEINDLYYKYEKRWTEVESKCLKGDSIPADARLAHIANEKKEKYFEDQF